MSVRHRWRGEAWQRVAGAGIAWRQRCLRQVGEEVSRTKGRHTPSVEKLTGSKINLITQHKTKNPDLLADNINDIRTEHIFFLKERGKRFAALTYIRRERVIQTPRNLGEKETKTAKNEQKRKKRKQPKPKINHWANQPARLQLLP
jgi:hypothetical protein